MSPDVERLRRLVRRADADLAEAALLCGARVETDVDVDAALLRVDALADVLDARGFVATGPEADARRLAGYLADELGFRGDPVRLREPEDALLPAVLDRRHGLPVTLTIVYVAIARRLGVAAYPVLLPGHEVAAIAGGPRPVVLDPFNGGRLLDEAAVADRVRRTTGGGVAFRRAMLRPATTLDVTRRLLDELVHDLTVAGRTRDALAAVELGLALPEPRADDHHAHGRLLVGLGRFDRAAEAFERYLEVAGSDAPLAEEVRRAAIAARARLN